MSLSFPLGYDDFARIREENFYYVDKTSVILELLKQKFQANLITRPRRFGKTLTMSMLEDFFDIRRDSRAHFEKLKISEHTKLCEAWQNQWPVIFLTLKSVEGNDFDTAYERLRILIAELFRKHDYLSVSSKVNPADAVDFMVVRDTKASLAQTTHSLILLTRMMAVHYGKPVILLIDEYDVPLAKASENHYYKEMLDVVRALFGVLKTNEFLKFAVVTGCLRMAKESIFTGTNNFVSDTITDDRFNEFIGFTQQDVEQLLFDANLTEYADKMKRWYDGYRFGMVEVYCPWDVLNYASALQLNPQAPPRSYWENTSHNGIIRQFIERRDLWEEEHINEDLETLINGGTIEKTVTTHLTYDTVHSSAENLWSLMFLTGYLTQVEVKASKNQPEGTEDSVWDITLRIPNEEIKSLFKTTVKEWFKDTVKSTQRNELFDALWNQDEDTCARKLTDMVFDTISFHDYKEDFYHAFVTGIVSYAGYKVKSNREQGEGRSDILLLDERNMRAIVIEVKHAKALKEQSRMCDEALRQIRENRYAKALEDEYEEILCYGISFYKKRCAVKSEKYK